MGNGYELEKSPYLYFGVRFERGEVIRENGLERLTGWHTDPKFEVGVESKPDRLCDIVTIHNDVIGFINIIYVSNACRKECSCSARII